MERAVKRLPPLFALAALAACTASSAQVAPPRHDSYYPTALAVSPDGRWLFVLSANSDLRYDSGTLQVLDLEQVDQAAEAAAQGLTPADARLAGCEQDPLVPSAMSCPTADDAGNPTRFAVAAASVTLGNFGSS